MNKLKQITSGNVIINKHTDLKWNVEKSVMSNFFFGAVSIYDSHQQVQLSLTNTKEIDIIISELQKLKYSIEQSNIILTNEIDVGTNSAIYIKSQFNSETSTVNYQFKIYDSFRDVGNYNHQSIDDIINLIDFLKGNLSLDSNLELSDTLIVSLCICQDHVDCIDLIFSNNFISDCTILGLTKFEIQRFVQDLELFINNTKTLM